MWTNDNLPEEIRDDMPKCPDCGSVVDDNDDSLEVCEWSHDTPPVCDTCGWDPCDGTC